MEEASELFEAITEYQMKMKTLEGSSPDRIISEISTYRKHITEEIADNFVILGQFLEYFGIGLEDVKNEAVFKINRTGKKYNIWRD